MEILRQNKKLWKKRLLIATPTLGLIRYEWYHARLSQIIPVNWESSGYDVPYRKASHILPYDVIGYSIDDAYNLITKKALELKVEWVLIIEDDVLIPQTCFLKMSEHMDKNIAPIVSGLYYLKGEPTLPLVFRGRGNGAFKDFKIGKKVWADGVPMGCLLVHASILKWLSENSPTYRISDGTITSKVFETPRKTYIDPQTGGWYNLMGTQDLYFCDRIIENKVFQKTGWTNIGRRKYPFLVDTSIFCKHIDLNTGRQYP